MTNKILLLHPTGNEVVRATAKALVESSMLMGFHTSIASFPNSFLNKLSGMKLFADFSRRQFDPALETYTHQFPWHELGRNIAIKAGLQYLVKHETGLLSVDRVYQSLDRYVSSRLSKIALQNVKAIYAYEDGAFHSFQRAKTLGMSCLYDLPIGYWRSARRFLATEQERWPAWSATLTGFLDSPAKLARKDEELQLADQIFVASTFTAQTLQEFPGTLPPVRVVPYGFPAVETTRTYATNLGQRALKVLFVGGLSQRKGIADLFAAVDTFGQHIELTVVGRKSTETCVALNQALSKHRWIPSLPHHEVLQLMRQHDVLVFPSLFEGFGLVITEAMSQGMPVITTERTAGPDLIRHGENGWLSQAGDLDSLRKSIETLLIQSKLVVTVGKEAQETAKQRPWSVYGQEMIVAINEVLTQKAII